MDKEPSSSKPKRPTFWELFRDLNKRKRASKSQQLLIKRNLQLVLREKPSFTEWDKRGLRRL